MTARFFYPVLSCLLFFFCSLGAQNFAGKADAYLMGRWAMGDSPGAWLLLAEQPPTQPQAHWSKEQRGRYVFEQLQTTAERSQAPLRGLLGERGVAHIPYWIVNALYLPELSSELAAELCSRPDVARILPNLPIRGADYRADPIDAALRDDQPEWGLVRIQADRLWALGLSGQGITVGGQDTGYDWQHPALINSYRGWDGASAQHDYHWHDAIHGQHPLNSDTLNPCGFDSPQPCDDGSHGTHTMGTMTGLAPDNLIGAAPQARWIGCRNMERGWGTPQSYIECFQWFLAPTDLQGGNPNPERAPHVINNSWGCPDIEGCLPSNFELMRLAVARLRHAGVVVVVSAGNDGPDCNSLANPAPIFGESFTVGATGKADTVTNFSSRGIVTSDGSNRLKPNVVAPGTQVRSCITGGGYAAYQGTSMAGPHVAGAVALLLSAAPEWAGQVERIEELLEQTALPLDMNQSCNGISTQIIPNPIFGYGRIDLWKALSVLRPDLVLDQPLATERLRLYPNPSADRVLLVTPFDMDQAHISLHTPLGQTVLRRTVVLERMYYLDITTLPEGLYILHLQSTEDPKKRCAAKLQIKRL